MPSPTERPASCRQENPSGPDGVVGSVWSYPNEAAYFLLFRSRPSNGREASLKADALAAEYVLQRHPLSEHMLIDFNCSARSSVRRWSWSLVSGSPVIRPVPLGFQSDGIPEMMLHCHHRHLHNLIIGLAPGLAIEPVCIVVITTQVLLRPDVNTERLARVGPPQICPALG